MYLDIKAGKKFRDMEDLCIELSEEFDELGERDISEFLRKEQELETDRKRHLSGVDKILSQKKM